MRVDFEGENYLFHAYKTSIKGRKIFLYIVIKEKSILQVIFNLKCYQSQTPCGLLSTYRTCVTRYGGFSHGDNTEQKNVETEIINNE